MHGSFQASPRLARQVWRTLACSLAVFGSTLASAEPWRCMRGGGDYKVYDDTSLVGAVAQAYADFGKVDVRCEVRPDLKVGATGNAQREAGSAPAQAAVVTGRINGPLFSTPGLRAASLGTEAEVTAIYLGDFKHARVEPTSPTFSVMIGSYISAFDSNCRAALPANKVEVMKTECARETYQVNGYGQQVGNSTCVEYRAVPSGVYAAPDVYAAQQAVEREVAGRTGAKIMSNLGAGIASVLDASKAVGNDMYTLVQQNGCTSPGLLRFQANLVRFALGQPGLTLPTGDTLESVRVRVAPAAGGTPTFKESNYSRLLDELIEANSQSWLMNKYQSRSVAQINVLGRDSAGQPRAIYAKYAFSASGRAGVGAVTLVFEDGLPKCLRFDDQRNECRIVSPAVVSQYERGQYIDAGATTDMPSDERCANIERMIERARRVRGAESSLPQLEANRDKFCAHH